MRTGRAGSTTRATHVGPRSQSVCNGHSDSSAWLPTAVHNSMYGRGSCNRAGLPPSHYESHERATARHDLSSSPNPQLRVFPDSAPRPPSRSRHSLSHTSAGVLPLQSFPYRRSCCHPAVSAQLPSPSFFTYRLPPPRPDLSRRMKHRIRTVLLSPRRRWAVPPLPRHSSARRRSLPADRVRSC